MPVTIVEVGKAPIYEYIIAGAILLMISALLAVIIIHIKDRKKRRPLFAEEVWILIMLLCVGFAAICVICQDIYASPVQDVNIAYINTSYSGQFLLEGSFPKAEDLRSGTTTDEDRLLYSGNDLEKIIKGNKYYIFKLDGIKTDVESAEEIVDKYNKKYGKNIKTEDLVIVRSDRY